MRRRSPRRSWRTGRQSRRLGGRGDRNGVRLADLPWRLPLRLVARLAPSLELGPRMDWALGQVARPDSGVGTIHRRYGLASFRRNDSTGTERVIPKPRQSVKVRVRLRTSRMERSPSSGDPSCDHPAMRPAGFEPATKGFKRPRVSTRLGLSHPPRSLALIPDGTSDYRSWRPGARRRGLLLGLTPLVSEPSWSPVPDQAWLRIAMRPSEECSA